MKKPIKKFYRDIYDKNYYLAKTILMNEWFHREINKLKKRMEDFGCPVPPKGFKKYADYKAWGDKYYKVRAERLGNKEYRDGVKKIIDSQTKVTSDIGLILDRFEAQHIPPVPGEIFRSILEHFDIKTNDRKFYDFIHSYFFFGKENYPRAMSSIILKRNSKTDELELYLRIFGYTTLEDINKHWNFIEKEQKVLPDYIGKNKKWGNFERDVFIFEEANNLRESNKKPIDILILNKFGKIHNLRSISQVRSVLSRTAKRLGKQNPNA